MVGRESSTEHWIRTGTPAKLIDGVILKQLFKCVRFDVVLLNLLSLYCW